MFSQAASNLAVGETVTLLQPPSAFSRCINSDGERASAKRQLLLSRLLEPGGRVLLGGRQRRRGAPTGASRGKVGPVVASGGGELAMVRRAEHVLHAYSRSRDSP